MSNFDLPASPVSVIDEDGDVELSSGEFEKGFRCSGLSKREYFAGLAMQAYVSGNLGWTDGVGGGSVGVDPEDAAKEAVNYADALLVELEK